MERAERLGGPTAQGEANTEGAASEERAQELGAVLASCGSFI